MKQLLQSPVIAALIVAAALVWAARSVANPVVRIAPGQTLAADGDIVIQAPNGFHVDSHGEIKLPENLNLKANWDGELPGK